MFQCSKCGGALNTAFICSFCGKDNQPYFQKTNDSTSVMWADNKTIIQQPLSGSQDSPKSAEPTSDNGERCTL